MTSQAPEEIERQFQKKLALAGILLGNIKENLDKLESRHEDFIRHEPDYVYRFYHQSFKLFRMNQQTRDARSLFESLAPDGTTLNRWFLEIVDEAVNKQFDSETTNHHWLRETRSILEAFWHSKYFLEQMIQATKDLDTAPQILPSGWVAVLYLCNLR